MVVARAPTAIIYSVAGGTAGGANHGEAGAEGRVTSQEYEIEYVEAVHGPEVPDRCRSVTRKSAAGVVHQHTWMVC